ncbi:multidrug efflux pump subunit AcrA (membrane-fusion protein) [Polymorphobacter multimanifer]|uniref:Multidrug efflux pump subunit AcrA (Membrane-fusion protein) n=1 Tax=Polymorphobacter multimanifer TaxID=1070431 RepID=A0A841L242_9SPHN|nr:HlyD family efflux transporter periplasmic adaptor subunit [Polymorphobacter multimanifer]MBB6226879.1 multidrug efflux pump subunit AcrA (membrane-fusion protein) [Polymorphobacter multimanifer]
MSTTIVTDALRPDPQSFPTLASINPPRVLRATGWMVGLGILFVILFAAFTPWVQTAPGSGTVIARDPAARQTNITAMVPGRLDRWYVTDGDYVELGDPIARVVDMDPQLLERLQGERGQRLAEIEATRAAMRTAELDVARTRTLFDEGLAARRDLELAQIKVAEFRGRIAGSEAEINKIDTGIRRQSQQLVTAPRAGRIMRVSAIDTATVVSTGDVLATFVPEQTERVVELYVDGRDVPLIHPGRRVRLEFEGWPAIQFSGWPSVAKGLFDGEVKAVDVSASPNGLFRILVVESPDRDPWPGEPQVRLGAAVRGWVLMNTVKVWFEWWRLLNDFPLQFTSGSEAGSAAGGSPPGGGSGSGSGRAAGGNAG